MVMIVLGVMLAATVTCFAQEAGFVDLTGIAPRTEFRQPATHNDEASHARRPAGRLQDCSANSTPALRTTLLWLDRSEYQVGDEEKFQVQIENIGSAPITIPFSPHVADLQPEDPGQRFRYLTLIVVLWLGGESWSESQGSGSEIALYGAHDRPDTMLTPRRGEWVQVIGKGTLTLSNNVLPLVRNGDAASYANANVSIYGVEQKLPAGASGTFAQGLCLIQSQGPNVTVKVSASK
jgi:hypothetical protein